MPRDARGARPTHMLDRNDCQDRRKGRVRRVRRGFSLLEMMVTLAIASVLLTFALPSFRTILSSSQISSTVNEFVFALQTARSEAIKRAGPVALCHSQSPLEPGATCDGSSFVDGWIVYADTDGSGTHNVDDELILQVEARAAAFVITPNVRYATEIRFSDTGASTNVAGIPVSGDVVIDYAGGEEVRTVSIGANGRISSRETAL